MPVRLLETKEGVRRAVAEAREAAAKRRRAGAPARRGGDDGGGSSRVVGLVPTMGFLHEGHLSLVRAARDQCELVVMSIFVNPTQFGPAEDLDRYPRDLDRDLALASEAGVDLVFHPVAAEMYAADHSTWVDVEGMTEHLCAASRPGHFRGVCTVVTKLLSICAPDSTYFGQKDAQQAFVIRRMVRDLDLDVEVVVCPTVREADGLAMSSRNVLLSPEERAQAPALRRALLEAERLVVAGARDPVAVAAAVRGLLAEAPSASVDYVEVVSTADLRPVEEIRGEVLVAAAVWLGGTRLIDNVVVAPGPALPPGPA